MDEPESSDVLLEELSTVLNQLTENPHDLSLVAEIVRISLSPGMKEHLESGLEMAASLGPVGDGVWLPLIERKLGQETAQSAEGVLEVLELFERAEGDYLCAWVSFVWILLVSNTLFAAIPVLQKHVKFLIDRHGHYDSEGNKPEELGELFSTEWTRAAISAVVCQASGHLTQVCH